MAPIFVISILLLLPQSVISMEKNIYSPNTSPCLSKKEKIQKIIHEKLQKITDKELQEIIDKELQEIANEKLQKITDEELQEIIDKGLQKIADKKLQKIANEVQKIINEYDPHAIESLIALGRNLPKAAELLDVKVFNNELLKKIRIKEDILNKLNTQNENVRKEIEEIHNTIKNETITQNKNNQLLQKKKRKKKKPRNNNDHKNDLQQNNSCPPPSNKYFFLVGLPCPPVKNKPQNYKLQQILAIKRTLLKNNNAKNEADLKKILAEYCFDHDRPCIFRQFNQSSAWHFVRENNSLSFFFDNDPCHCNHGDLSSSSSCD